MRNLASRWLVGRNRRGRAAQFLGPGRLIAAEARGYVIRHDARHVEQVQKILKTLQKSRERQARKHQRSE